MNSRIITAVGIMLMIIGFGIIIAFFIDSNYHMVGVSIVVILIGIAVLVTGFVVLLIGARKSV